MILASFDESQELGARVDESIVVVVCVEDPVGSFTVADHCQHIKNKNACRCRSETVYQHDESGATGKK